LAQLQKDLSEFVALLNSLNVEFVIVGGHAVAFHGHPRFTGDIDFLVNPSKDNAERVLAVLTAFGFGSLPITVDDLTAPERVVQLGQPPNRIDILTSISGVSFQEAWDTRVAGDAGGHTVNFLGWDALIQNKTASGRDKDQADVKTLLKMASRRKGV
jgi:predicted nucleotidyltransferase